MKKADQQALWRAAQSDDRRAQAELFEFLEGAAKAMLSRWHALPPEELDEIVSEAKAKWMSQPYDPAKGAAPLTWFLKLAHNVAVDHFRKPRIPIATDYDIFLARAPGGNEDQGELAFALRSIPELERELILGNAGVRLCGDRLIHGVRYTEEQLGEMFGMKRHQVSRRKREGLKMLARVITERQGGGNAAGAS